MSTMLEVMLTRSLLLKKDDYVAFDVHSIDTPGITYNNQTGEITFIELGQYSIKWWISTETTLKGAIVFDLYSTQGLLAPGCSPIKTGQVAGFSVINVTAPGTIVALVNRSITDTMISRKTRTKAYLLITPIGSSSPRVYHGNLSTPGSSMEVPLGNGLIYRLEYLSTTQVRLFFTPMNGTTVYDYRRFSAYDGAGIQGGSSDTTTLNQSTTIDSDIYNNSREMHWIVVRVKDPLTGLWSTYEVRLFVSGAGTRTLVWVNVIEEEVSY